LPVLLASVTQMLRELEKSTGHGSANGPNAPVDSR
jgi:hypothetical protein